MRDFERFGDKENSALFEELLPKLYAQKESNGQWDNLGQIKALLVQTEPGEAVNYIAEMSLLTPYRWLTGFETEAHRVHWLRVKPGLPDYVVLEPKRADYADVFSRIAQQHPATAQRSRIKFIGEVFAATDLATLAAGLKQSGIRQLAATPHALFGHADWWVSEVSPYSRELTAYTTHDLSDPHTLCLGPEFVLNTAERSLIEQAVALQEETGIHQLVVGIDHLNSRILSNEREMALLEYVAKTSYYFWGAYHIPEVRSSTNVLRHPEVKDEVYSPAKVFTAADTPYFADGVMGSSSPTENFVRNFGQRSHHIAYQVVDGEVEDGRKNIDFVVQELFERNVPFLDKVYGACGDIPDLKQIFSEKSPYSLIITEYVQRCKSFAGFFSKNNVANLTMAAGMSEGVA